MCGCWWHKTAMHYTQISLFGNISKSVQQTFDKVNYSHSCTRMKLDGFIRSNICERRYLRFSVSENVWPSTWTELNSTAKRMICYAKVDPWVHLPFPVYFKIRSLQFKLSFALWFSLSISFEHRWISSSSKWFSAVHSLARSSSYSRKQLRALLL